MAEITGHEYKFDGTVTIVTTDGRRHEYGPGDDRPAGVAKYLASRDDHAATELIRAIAARITFPSEHEQEHFEVMLARAEQLEAGGDPDDAFHTKSAAEEPTVDTGEPSFPGDAPKPTPPAKKSTARTPTAGKGRGAASKAPATAGAGAE